MVLLLLVLVVMVVVAVVAAVVVVVVAMVVVVAVVVVVLMIIGMSCAAAGGQRGLQTAIARTPPHLLAGRSGCLLRLQRPWRPGKMTQTLTHWPFLCLGRL